MSRIVTVEFKPVDAYRLLWLIQKEATGGKIYNQYWGDMANRLRQNIAEDTGELDDIESLSLETELHEPSPVYRPPERL